MLCEDVIYLIAESPAAHGVFDTRVETPRMVYCTIRSVTANEYYKAKEANIEPTFVFVLSDYSEYHGEKLLTYHDKRYRVVRTYVRDMEIELTVEEATNDA